MKNVMGMHPINQRSDRFFRVSSLLGVVIDPTHKARHFQVTHLQKSGTDRSRLAHGLMSMRERAEPSTGLVNADDGGQVLVKVYLAHP